MRDDLMELLRLFGVPYVEAPSEAEAQCAVLEKLGLVDGVITDDSDVWLFGATEVYKNIFNESKYVEIYKSSNILHELGLKREDYICLALLLGSDYTIGIHGIGIVNATEIIRVFPGINGLKEFKVWIDNADKDELINNGKTYGSKQKLTKKEVSLLSDKDKFKYEHRKARRRWRLNENFPSKAVIDAYMNPMVDSSTNSFSWSTPDLIGLRIFMNNKLGWSEDEVNKQLLPVMKELSKRKSAQTRIDGYFSVTYDDNKRAAKFQSKRLIEATNALRRKNDQKSINIASMIKKSPHDFNIYFPNTEERLQYCMEQNTKDLIRALEKVQNHRLILEKKNILESCDNDEDNDDKKQQEVTCYIYLESLMKTILENRNDYQEMIKEQNAEEEEEAAERRGTR